MKRVVAFCLPAMMALMCLSLFAQGPRAGGPGGPGGGGFQGRGGGRGGGRGAVPPATGPVADATNKIIEAINKQDAAFFTGALTADATLADEDGHVVPANIWAQRLTAQKKTLAITNLRVGELGSEGGWAVFSYTLDETTAQGSPNQMKGTSTIVFKKNGNDLQVAHIQLSVNGPAITPH